MNDGSERARLSLEGLSVGDAFGERFFAPPAVAQAMIANRALPQRPWPVTDDTMMALSIVEILDAHGCIEQDALADRFAARYAAAPDRGYGGMAHEILRAIGRGRSWREVAPAAFDGTGSMGNGGAMRAAPIGAFFAGDRKRAAEEARLSAEVTHAHPEGQAGAIAVAVAAAAIAAGETRFFDTVLAHLPSGDTRAGVEDAAELAGATPIDRAVERLGNGSRVLAWDTVPFALWCAARHLDDFEAALWATVTGLGDRDTTCAIVGGLVVLRTGIDAIPFEWLLAREALERLSL
jgi:ADP-ribosylglycohydrolase